MTPEEVQELLRQKVAEILRQKIAEELQKLQANTFHNANQMPPLRVPVDSGAGPDADWLSNSWGYYNNKYGADMAWNYETGQDEPNPYTDPDKGGPYTSPHFSYTSIKEALDWHKAEANLLRAVQWGNIDLANALRGAAINCWLKLEKAMTFKDVAQSTELRRGYIEWLSTNMGKTTATQAQVIEEVDLNSLPLLERIIQAGYHKLAKEAHPDAGGEPEKFREITQARGQLMAIIKDLKEVL